MSLAVTAPAPRLLDAGDAAFTIEFGDAIEPALLAAVQSLDLAIARLQASGALPGLIETMPTFRSLTVFFDPLVTGRAALIDALRPLFDGAVHAVPVAGRRWRLPVCYEGDLAPDLAGTARALGIGTDEVIALHTGGEVNVHMLGFLPGCAFMGPVNARLNLPRRSEPRVRVPAGSVAVANGLTIVYPWESPGGWHLLGRCPVPMFDASRGEPALLAVGDRVGFEAIARAEYQHLLDGLQSGAIDPARWCNAAEGGGAAPAGR